MIKKVLAVSSVKSSSMYGQIVVEVQPVFDGVEGGDGSERVLSDWPEPTLLFQKGSGGTASCTPEQKPMSGSKERMADESAVPSPSTKGFLRRFRLFW